MALGSSELMEDVARLFDLCVLEASLLFRDDLFSREERRSIDDVLVSVLLLVRGSGR